MKHVLNYRYYVLAILAGIAIVALFADLDSNDTSSFADWLGCQFAYKVIAIACTVLYIRLYNYWSLFGKLPLFYELSKFLKNLGL